MTNRLRKREREEERERSRTSVDRVDFVTSACACYFSCVFHRRAIFAANVISKKSAKQLCAFCVVSDAKSYR